MTVHTHEWSLLAERRRQCLGCGAYQVQTMSGEWIPTLAEWCPMTTEHGQQMVEDRGADPSRRN